VEGRRQERLKSDDPKLEETRTRYKEMERDSLKKKKKKKKKNILYLQMLNRTNVSVGV
jgi:hypothetical protein